MSARRIPVVCINSRGEVSGYYESMKEAARIAGVSAKTISNAIRLGKWCRKHRWMKEAHYREYWMKGRTEELKNSYRESRIEAARKRIACAGKEGCKAWFDKLSKARKNYLREHPERMIKQPKRVLCTTTGEEFASASDFARKYGLHASNVCRAARTGIKVKGMNLKYI